MLALTAPEISRPHEVDTILRVAGWLDYEDCNTLRDRLDDYSLVEVLQAVQNGTLTADKPDITWAPGQLLQGQQQQQLLQGQQRQSQCLIA